MKEFAPGRFWLIRLASIAIALAACFGVERFVQGNDYLARILVLIGIYITLAVSLNLINGITGQFSIGHAAFYMIGAYVSGYLTVLFSGRLPLSGPLWLTLMVLTGALTAGLAGWVVGLPSLRLRGDYLAIVTLGFGEIVRIVVQSISQVGGSYGMNIAPKLTPIWMVWGLAVLCIATCRNLLKTAHGLPFLAVREDEVAASAMGVNVTLTKVTAFMLGSAFAGAAGALIAHYEGFITPASFDMNISFIILTIVVLGGTGSITGSVIAAAFLTYLPYYLEGQKNSAGHVLTVSGPVVIGGFLAVVIVTALLRQVIARGGASPLLRTATIFGIVVLGVLFAATLSIPLRSVSGLAAKSFEIGQLRMAIFALTLVVVMLLRPQGILAHHEFSWGWVRSMFSRGHKA